MGCIRFVRDRGAFRFLANINNISQQHFNPEPSIDQREIEFKGVDATDG